MKMINSTFTIALSFVSEIQVFFISILTKIFLKTTHSQYKKPIKTTYNDKINKESIEKT